MAPSSVAGGTVIAGRGGGVATPNAVSAWPGSNAAAGRSAVRSAAGWSAWGRTGAAPLLVCPIRGTGVCIVGTPRGGVGSINPSPWVGVTIRCDRAPRYNSASGVSGRTATAA